MSSFLSALFLVNTARYTLFLSFASWISVGSYMIDIMSAVRPLMTPLISIPGSDFDTMGILCTGSLKTLPLLSNNNKLSRLLTVATNLGLSPLTVFTGSVSVSFLTKLFSVITILKVPSGILPILLTLTTLHSLGVEYF